MRVIYWNTSCLQPEIEAISKEVFQLARHFDNSLIFGISRHYGFRCSFSQRYIGFHHHFDPLLRFVIPLLERWCDVNHVYGEPTPWTFYKTLRRKPIVLTIAAEKGAPRQEFLQRCRKIIVQSEGFRRKMHSLGVDQDRVTLLYPGVDLSRFRPGGRVSIIGNHVKVLFASAPRSREEMEQRGVNLLLEAAKDSEDIQYHFLYRKWEGGYTSFDATKNILREHGLTNVILTNTAAPEMWRVFAEHHFTVIPYTKEDGGKECPNSAVEGLACGLPALVSTACPFAQFVDQHECGVTFDPEPASLIRAVEIGMRRYEELSRNAARVAETHFCQARLLERMAEIYREVTGLGSGS